MVELTIMVDIAPNIDVGDLIDYQVGIFTKKKGNMKCN
jgi:hypothetical protein